MMAWATGFTIMAGLIPGYIPVTMVMDGDSIIPGDIIPGDIIIIAPGGVVTLDGDMQATTDMDGEVFTEMDGEAFIIPIIAHRTFIPTASIPTATMPITGAGGAITTGIHLLPTRSGEDPIWEPDPAGMQTGTERIAAGPISATGMVSLTEVR